MTTPAAVYYTTVEAAEHHVRLAGTLLCLYTKTIQKQDYQLFSVLTAILPIPATSS
jgi:hypothetical protein